MKSRRIVILFAAEAELRLYAAKFWNWNLSVNSKPAFPHEKRAVAVDFRCPYSTQDAVRITQIELLRVLIFVGQLRKHDGGILLASIGIDLGSQLETAVV